ncbi:twin-arginine translocation signal domain-containing protein, partial [bacterium]|nr:twin-arginine translocation signal domain-containing protein [bacterium]
MTSDSSRDSVQTRRRFLQLGAATVSASVLSGCTQEKIDQEPRPKQSLAATQETAGSNAPPQGIDLEKWKKL